MTGSTVDFNAGTPSSFISTVNFSVSLAALDVGAGTGALTLNSSGSTISNAVITDASLNSVTFNVGIIGSSSLTLNSPALAVLNNGSGATYSGATTVNSGTLSDNANHAFSPNSLVAINSAGTLAVNDHEIIGNLENGGGGGGTVTIAAGKTLTSMGISYSSDFTGNISGGGAFTVSGGVQGLGGNNTYTGGTAVSGGELFVSSNTAVGTGTLTFSSGTEFSPDANVTLANSIVLNGSMAIENDDDGNWGLTLTGAISGTNGLTWCTPGTLTLTHANPTFTGGVDMREGTLLLGNDTAAGIGGITLDTGAILGTVGGPGVTRIIGNAIDLSGTSAQIGAAGNNFLTVNG